MVLVYVASLVEKKRLKMQKIKMLRSLQYSIYFNQILNFNVRQCKSDDKWPHKLSRSMVRVMGKRSHVMNRIL